MSIVGGASDLVLDESRNQVYLTASTANQVQIYSISRKAFLTPIATDQTPLAAALSRDNQSLYVVCYNGRSLDVINLATLTLASKVSLPVQPEGVAVGKDGRVLISTVGTSAGADVLMLYDPSPTAAIPLAAIPIAPPAPTPATFPAPSGRAFLADHSRLISTRNGSFIAGVDAPATGSPTLFVYESASASVLRARIVAGSSTVISISDDGSRILCGPNLFDASTLAVLAQQNLANAPYPITPTAAFNLASNQGGGVFAPDGSVLYSVFDVAPVGGAASTSQLMESDPDNLLIRMGIQLPENLSGKMTIGANGAAIYGLSDSGFIVLPVGTIAQSPLAVPSSQALLLTNDQCGATAATSSAILSVANAGGGTLTAAAQLLQYAGQAGQASPATAPSIQTSQTSSGAQFTFNFNTAVGATLGTVNPPHDFIFQSTQAINIPNRVRVYENNRNAEARGTVIPIATGPVNGETLPDLIMDSTRQRLYIANAGLNRVEVFDLVQQKFLAPIKVGQLPNSMALTPDGYTLYVLSAGGESISIVDPDAMQTTGNISFPPIPFNSSTALVTPSVMAVGLSGPLVLTSDGTIWTVVGNSLVPQGVSQLLGTTAAGAPVKITMPATMAATPGGEYILMASSNGTVYLYDATAANWVASRAVFSAAATGYIGPIAAGPGGQYFIVNGQTLNTTLTNASGRATGLASAVASMGGSTFAVFSPPSSGTGVPALQVLDAKSASAGTSYSALEGPLTQVTTGRGTISGRAMAVDSAGANAYVVTISGLSIVPLTTTPASNRPAITAGGVVNTVSLQTAVTANGLLSIFGQNLAGSGTFSSTPMPTVMGGVCVTLNNIAVPLFMTSSTQINVQIPPGFATGSFPLVVRSIANQAASASQTVTVSKYAPAVMMAASGQPALYHMGGTPVNADHPATRDEKLILYVTGLGPTTGGTVAHRPAFAVESARERGGRGGVYWAYELRAVGDHCELQLFSAGPGVRLSDQFDDSRLPHERQCAADYGAHRQCQQPDDRTGSSVCLAQLTFGEGGAGLPLLFILPFSSEGENVMGTDTTVRLVAAILLVVVLAILILRRKGKKAKKDDDEF